MRTGKGQIVEWILENGIRHARIACPADLMPAPGQYLLGGNATSPDPLPASLFSTASSSKSFISCTPIPETWTPGTEINLRGPLGRGFSMPLSARKVVLVPFDNTSARLRGLIRPALVQGAAVVLVCDTDEENLPDEVELQPLSALDDILSWADYVALDVERENLPRLKDRLGDMYRSSVKGETQVLIHTPVPCGGVAECGVCAVTLKSAWRLACRDGPVFDWGEI